jgi:hypothetical protein
MTRRVERVGYGRRLGVRPLPLDPSARVFLAAARADEY